DEVVSTYIRLEKLSDLKFPGHDPTDPESVEEDLLGATKSVLFADVLEFTTTLKAGVKPVLTLTALNGSLRLTNASVAVTAKRRDVHVVIVALARDKNLGDIDPAVARDRQRGAARKYPVADRHPQTVQFGVNRKVNEARQKRNDIILNRDVVDRR